MMSDSAKKLVELMEIKRDMEVACAVKKYRDKLAENYEQKKR